MGCDDQGQRREAGLNALSDQPDCFAPSPGIIPGGRGEQKSATAPGVVHQTRSRLECSTQCFNALRNGGSRNGCPMTKGCSDSVITSGCARHCSIISSKPSTIMSAKSRAVPSRWMIAAESLSSAGYGTERIGPERVFSQNG